MTEIVVYLAACVALDAVSYIMGQEVLLLSLKGCEPLSVIDLRLLQKSQGCDTRHGANVHNDSLRNPHEIKVFRWQTNVFYKIYSTT